MCTRRHELLNADTDVFSKLPYYKEVGCRSNLMFYSSVRNQTVSAPQKYIGIPNDFIKNRSNVELLKRKGRCRCFVSFISARFGSCGFNNDVCCLC